jgi:hypothetical protein
MRGRYRKELQRRLVCLLAVTGSPRRTWTDCIDVTMNLSDGMSTLQPLLSCLQHETRQSRVNEIDTFIQLADGKLNGQKAFMTGALKVKGNVMLAVSLLYSIHFTPV